MKNKDNSCIRNKCGTTFQYFKRKTALLNEIAYFKYNCAKIIELNYVIYLSFTDSVPIQ